MSNTQVDEHLNWKTHIASVATKLCRANGALSKLRYFVPTKILLNVYHAIFASHTRYASQIWGLCDNSVTHRILTLQNFAMRLLTFNGPRVSATPLYAELGVLKFFDQVEIINCVNLVLTLLIMVCTLSQISLLNNGMICRNIFRVFGFLNSNDQN